MKGAEDLPAELQRAVWGHAISTRLEPSHLAELCRQMLKRGQSPEAVNSSLDRLAYYRLPWWRRIMRVIYLKARGY